MHLNLIHDAIEILSILGYNNHTDKQMRILGVGLQTLHPGFSPFFVIND